MASNSNQFIILQDLVGCPGFIWMGFLQVCLGSFIDCRKMAAGAGTSMMGGFLRLLPWWDGDKAGPGWNNGTTGPSSLSLWF